MHPAKVAECNDATRDGCANGCATRRAARAPRSCLIVRSRCGRARWSAATARGGSPPSRLAPPRRIARGGSPLRCAGWHPAPPPRFDCGAPSMAPSPRAHRRAAGPHCPWRLATAPPHGRAYDFLRNSGTISITFAHSASGSAEISAILFSSCRQSGSYSYNS